MGGRRRIEVWRGYGVDWTVRSYEWRGPMVRSPFTDRNMRAIVVKDGDGMFRPGLRNGGRYPETEYQTIYHPFAKFADRGAAINEARAMLGDALAQHRHAVEDRIHDASWDKESRASAQRLQAQTDFHALKVMQAFRRELRESGPAWKPVRYVWQGPLTTTRNGLDIRAVVCIDDQGGFRAGERYGPRGCTMPELGTQEFWSTEKFQTKLTAIAGATRIVSQTVRGCNRVAETQSRKAPPPVMER